VVTRAVLMLLVAAASAALMAGAASAALLLRFSTTRAAPGATVTLETGGRGALSSIAPGAPPLRVFLIRADEVDLRSPDLGVSSPDDSRLIPLGELTVDAEGNGELRFTVPDVPAGNYTTLTHCVPCAPSSAGRELLPTGPFPEPFVVLGDGASGAGFPIAPVALAAGGGVLILAVLAWVARSRRTCPSDDGREAAGL
jgi:hypothetical protein